MNRKHNSATIRWPSPNVQRPCYGNVQPWQPHVTVSIGYGITVSLHDSAMQGQGVTVSPGHGVTVSLLQPPRQRYARTGVTVSPGHRITTCPHPGPTAPLQPMRSPPACPPDRPPHRPRFCLPQETQAAGAQAAPCTGSCPTAPRRTFQRRAQALPHVSAFAARRPAVSPAARSSSGLRRFPCRSPCAHRPPTQPPRCLPRHTFQATALRRLS